MKLSDLLIALLVISVLTGAKTQCTDPANPTAGCIKCTESACTACMTNFGLSGGACAACTNGFSDGTGPCQTYPSNKALILKFHATYSSSIKWDEQAKQYVYDQAIPFKNVAISFQSKIMETYRAAIKVQYGIQIKPELSLDELDYFLASKLRQFGTLALKKFILEGESLRAELSRRAIIEEILTPKEQEALAKRIMQPLSRLYDRTYGTTIKQSQADKYNMLVGFQLYNNGLKEWFDTHRKVLGMKPLATMPETFLYFHQKAKRITSQYDQDGVIAAIFEAIQKNHQNNKYFVEVGGGSVVDNTAYLRNNEGWQGKLFNSGTYYMEKAKQFIIQEFVSPEAAVSIFKKHNVPTQFDFLSIDVDTRDCWIWAAIAQKYRPAVVSVQFNSNFGANVSVSVSRKSSAGWGEDISNHYDKYYGCSIKNAVDIAAEHGYAYVYHHPYTDVFFVRKELLPPNLPPVDFTKTFDAIPLHLVDAKFKYFQILNQAQSQSFSPAEQNSNLNQAQSQSFSPAEQNLNLKLAGYYLLGAGTMIALYFIEKYWRGKKNTNKKNETQLQSSSEAQSPK